MQVAAKPTPFDRQRMQRRSRASVRFKQEPEDGADDDEVDAATTPAFSAQPSMRHLKKSQALRATVAKRHASKYGNEQSRFLNLHCAAWQVLRRQRARVC